MLYPPNTSSVPAAARVANALHPGRLDIRADSRIPFVTAGFRQTWAIVAELGIGHKTAEFHRAKVMAKLQAKTLAHLTCSTGLGITLAWPALF